MTLFVAVCQHGTMSAAGRSLGITTAQVSRRVQALEERLGVRLLNRTTRRLSPTEAGLLYLDRARVISEDIESLEASLRELQTDVRGLLRVTAPIGFGRLYIVPLLPGFLQQHPQLRIQLDLSDRPRDLLADGFDLAIRSARLDDSSLVARSLGVSRQVTVATPAYLARRGTPRHPLDLMQHECVIGHRALGGGGLGPAFETWRYEGEDGVHEVRVQGALSINVAEMTLEPVLQGFGIGIRPTWHVAGLLREGRLVPLLSQWNMATLPFYAVFPHRRLQSRKLTAFIDWLLQAYGTPPVWS